MEHPTAEQADQHAVALWAVVAVLSGSYRRQVGVDPWNCVGQQVVVSAA